MTTAISAHVSTNGLKSNKSNLINVLSSDTSALCTTTVMSSIVVAACVRALWRESESDDLCSFPPRRYDSNKKFTHCVIQTLNGDSTQVKSTQVESTDHYRADFNRLGCCCLEFVTSFTQTIVIRFVTVSFHFFLLNLLSTQLCSATFWRRHNKAAVWAAHATVRLRGWEL